jgi:hypothetical protein
MRLFRVYNIDMEDEVEWLLVGDFNLTRQPSDKQARRECARNASVQCSYQQFEVGRTIADWQQVHLV